MTDRELKSVRKAAKKAAALRGPRGDKADGEAAVLAKIAAMPAPCCAMGERLHALILRSVPTLQPTLYYGMPWYAKDAKRVCFFRANVSSLPANHNSTLQFKIEFLKMVGHAINISRSNN